MSVKKGAAETRRLYHSAAYECGLRTAECRIFLIPLHQDNLAFQSSSWITITNPVSLMCVPSYFYSSFPLRKKVTAVSKNIILTRTGLKIKRQTGKATSKLYQSASLNKKCQRCPKLNKN